jgi:hypothetical protein
LIVYKPLAPGEADKAPRRKKRTQKAAAKSASQRAETTSQKETLNAKTQ